MNPQYFLPMVTGDRRVVGLVPISETTYVGDELSQTLGAVTYSLRRITFTRQPSGKVMDYMSIYVSPQEERNEFRNLDSYLRTYTSTRYWGEGHTRKYNLMGDLEYFLEGGLKSMDVVVVPPAPTMNPLVREWAANAPFANAPNCQFFDLTWARLTGLSDVTNIQTVSVGAPSADPGNGASLKAMLVYPSNQVNLADWRSVVRIMRVTKNAVVPGAYVWPLTVTDKFGQVTTVNVTINAS